MGTNWYMKDCDESHIGKFTFRNGMKHFIFYRSKEFQILRMKEMFEGGIALSEEGEERPLSILTEELVNIPFLEEDVEFF